MKYRRISEEIDAVQFRDDNEHEYFNFMSINKIVWERAGDTLILHFTNGNTRISKMWWVVKEDSDNISVMSDEKFGELYESVA